MIAFKLFTIVSLVGLSSAAAITQLPNTPTCRMACPEGQICKMGDMGVAGCSPINHETIQQ